VELPDIKGKSFTLLDVPGQGFFKRDMMDNLPNSKLVVVIIDSADK
jgi:signal recognition particle receptor subunit beta